MNCIFLSLITSQIKGFIVYNKIVVHSDKNTKLSLILKK